MKTNLTNEQLAVINYVTALVNDRISGKKDRAREIIKVNAFAGTGKTTTLKAITNSIKDNYPQVKCLYVVFNANMRLESAAKFPKNTDVVTSHSLAYKTFGAPLRHKLESKEMTMKDVAQYLGLDSKSDYALMISRIVMDTLKEFFHSKDMEISVDNIQNNTALELDAKTSATIVILANKLFNGMLNKEDLSIKVTHDAYLKKFQISQPKLVGYDIILLDEAQDTNPCVLDILLKQKADLILVGDAHQSIYQWRGVINAMEKTKSTKTFYLTKSHRFGAEIAGKANIILGTFKKENKALTGAGKTELDAGEKHTEAYLARTNATLIQRGIEYARTGRKIYINGGIFSLGVEECEQLMSICEHDYPKVKSSRLKGFRELDEVLSYAEKTNDIDLLSKAQWVSNLIDSKVRSFTGARVDFAKLRAAVVEDEKNANITLSTVHKAKGLEWHSVTIDGDVLDFVSKIFSYHTNKLIRMYDKNEKIQQYTSYASFNKQCTYEKAYMTLTYLMLEEFDTEFEKMMKKIAKDIRDEANVTYVAITRARLHCNAAMLDYGTSKDYELYEALFNKFKKFLINAALLGEEKREEINKFEEILYEW